MKLVLVALFAAFTVTAAAQPSAIIVRGIIADTCRVGLDTVDIGKTQKQLVVAPRIEFEGFDVCGADTSFRWGPDGRMVHYWICYKVEAITSNCPWISYQRYTPIKCR